ncbi:hypothetical protein NQ318_003840, partial [Aromia moschata]
TMTTAGFAVILLVVLAPRARALPDGAPLSVCRSLMPNHGGQGPQTGIPAYSVIARRQGGGVVVWIGSTVGVRFQGVLLQGRTTAGDVLGSFELPVGSEAHTIDCEGPGDSVTHNKAKDKEFLSVIWKPPQGYEGDIVFNATIAQNYNTFWVGVVSTPVRVSRDAVNDPIPEYSFQPNRPTSTTPPNFVREVPREASTDFDPFYDGCSASKLCFGAPINCVASKSCKAVVAVTVAGDKYDFELKADGSAAWVGVGLSDDDKMGRDSVIECVKRGSGLAAFMSWTNVPPTTPLGSLT